MQMCEKCNKDNKINCAQKKEIIKRLNVIEGQIRGIKEMLVTDRCCDEIIIQMSASMNSLRSLANKMLKNHMKTCMVEGIKNNNLEVIDDVINLIDKVNR